MYTVTARPLCTPHTTLREFQRLIGPRAFRYDDISGTCTFFFTHLRGTNKSIYRSVMKQGIQVAFEYFDKGGE